MEINTNEKVILVLFFCVMTTFIVLHKVKTTCLRAFIAFAAVQNLRS